MESMGIREVKNKLSEALSKAKEAPITITNHGKPDAVLMSYAMYQKFVPQETGLDVFETFDWSDIELEVQPNFKARELNVE